MHYNDATYSSQEYVNAPDEVGPELGVYRGKLLKRVSGYYEWQIGPFEYLIITFQGAKGVPTGDYVVGSWYEFELTKNSMMWIRDMDPLV